MGIRIRLIILLLVMALPFAYATQSEIERNIIMGDILSEALDDDISVPIEEQIRSMQEISSGDVVQVGQKEVLIEQQKIWILNRISVIWELVIGLFILIFEIIKQSLYIVEIWFLTIIVFKIIPTIIIKIRDGILKWYLKIF